MATYHEEKPGGSISGMVIERKPWFGLRNAKQRRAECELQIEINTQELENLDDDALYDSIGHATTIVSRTAKTITVKNRWGDTFRISLSKFDDGRAYHDRGSFEWGGYKRRGIEADLVQNQQGLARAEADCAKWQQRVQDDPEGWYDD